LPLRLFCIRVMKIILKTDYENLGSAGDIKEVKDGYARNFLIPKGIAVVATPSNIKAYEEIKRQKRRKIEKETRQAEELAKQLESLSLVIKMKAADESKLFGSVTSMMIYELLKEKGFETIERKKILLAEPIKTLGEHTVPIRLFGGIVANLKVVVEKEEIKE
jgi:large subunit ribosomal protein L9